MHATTPAAHAAAPAVTAAPTAPATARQGGPWLGKYQNAGDGGDGNTQTGCDADGFHTDLLLLVTADMAAQGTGYGAASWCYFSPKGEIEFNQRPPTGRVRLVLGKVKLYFTFPRLRSYAYVSSLPLTGEAGSAISSRSRSIENAVTKRS
jgi:hypothetical protein